jgi:hypothetical protein
MYNFIVIIPKRSKPSASAASDLTLAGQESRVEESQMTELTRPKRI